MTNAHLSQLSSYIAEHGTAGVEAELVQLARLARRRRVATVAAAAMTDRASPRVVRERAFAVVCAALTSQRRASMADMPLAS
jgi:hypothetical protein